jgi:hypothetical protein
VLRWCNFEEDNLDTKVVAAADRHMQGRLSMKPQQRDSLVLVVAGMLVGWKTHHIPVECLQSGVVYLFCIGPVHAEGRL